jgi:uncharacterized protein
MSNSRIKRELCFDCLKKTAPTDIVRHSLVVNRVAMIIGSELASRLPKGTIDTNLIDCASLLHDIAKPPTEGHESAGAAAIAKLGTDYKDVAEIVLQHGLCGHPVTWEQIVVNYADKLVKHDQVVTLKERLKDLEDRRPQEAAKFSEAWPKIEKMQRRILSILNRSEEELVKHLIEIINGNRPDSVNNTASQDGVY